VSTSTTLGVFKESIDGATETVNTTGGTTFLEILIPGLILLGLIVWSLVEYTKNHNDD